MSDFIFLKDLQPEDVSEVVGFLSDSDAHALLNMRMFELLQEFYKNRLDVNIILPKTKQQSKKGLLSWINQAISKIPFVASNKTYENVDLFHDYLTTDALDYAITEVPIESQFLKEIGECNEEESVAKKLLLCIKDVKKNYSLLGSSLEEKYKLLEELEQKLVMQDAYIMKKDNEDEDETIFVV